MKTSTFFRRACAPLIALPLVLPAAGAGGKGREKDIVLTPVGTYSAKIFDRGAAEIVAHDPATQRLFVVNGARVVVDGVPVVTPKIDVLSIADPASPSLPPCSSRST